MYTVFKKNQDAFEISLLKSHIKKGDVVIDVGANIGFYSEIFSELVAENGRVYCFEPDEKNFLHLKNRTGQFQNVSIYHKAVSEKTHTLKIYTSKLLNVDHRTYKPDDYDKETDVEAVALDTFLNLPKADFIKIDIQGFEMNAMQGMVTLLKSPNIKILSEFWPYGLKKAGSNITEYFNFLETHGFNLSLIDGNKLMTLTAEIVSSYMDLPENVYMNIFAEKK